MTKEWLIQKPDVYLLEQIKKKYHCHHITAAILANRLPSLEDASLFIAPSFNHLHSPFEIKDIDKAVYRICLAIQNKEKILIFGDYDVDGVTSVSVLFEFLTYAGADVSYYIPHRMEEGYGFKAFHVKKLTEQFDIDLLITVDCGSKSYDAVLESNRLGIDVIITDHHEANVVPKAYAVVNPKQPDCHAGFEYLAGVGVVFCLIICLRKQLRDLNYWQPPYSEPNLKDFCDLVALGTIADIVPLLHDNRIFVQAGLEVISEGKRPGIQALKNISEIKKPFVDASDIAFKLSPRINAAGRLYHSDVAVELLTTSCMKKAKQIAATLDDINCQRRQLENSIYTHIETYLKDHPNDLKKHSIVLMDQSWHEGVIGIVASRLVDKYHMPVILFSQNNGIGKGSARSIPTVDMHQTLESCCQHIEAFGGHKMAAGLTIQTKQFSAFRDQFDAIVQKSTCHSDFKSVITIDYLIKFHEISEQLVNELEKLGPFGSGNQEPIFGAYNIQVRSANLVGGSHRRMVLSQLDGYSENYLEAIQFNVNPLEEVPHTLYKVAFKTQWNYWNGKKTIQLLIEEIN